MADSGKLRAPFAAKEACHHDGEDRDVNTLMERTTHLPYAAEPPYENPNFFEEPSWWTSSSPSAMPDQVLNGPFLENCHKAPHSLFNALSFAGRRPNLLDPRSIHAIHPSCARGSCMGDAGRVFCLHF